MCFSANASLATGIALLPAGAYCLTVALRKNRKYLPLAAVPLLFGIQQLFETGVWIGLQENRPNLVQPSSLGFLFFAVALWPIWIPISAAILEKQRGRRRLFYACAAVGVGFALLAYLPVALFARDWLRVEIVNHSLSYDLSNVPAGVWAAAWVWNVLYLVAACAPLLFSGERQLRLLGIAVAVSAVITHAMFRYAFISVWCFFAALLSLHICYVISRIPNVRAGPINATGSEQSTSQQGYWAKLRDSSRRRG